VASPTANPNISIRVDTNTIATRLRVQKGIDSLGVLITTGDAAKLNISDTAAMLTPNYRRTITKITNSDLVNSTISGTALGSNLPALSFGTYLQNSATSYNGTTANTISTNATSSNIGSTLVARDVNGDFSARNISAALVGNASSASTINITNDNSTNATMYPIWSAAISGTNSPKVSSTKITFNPSTGVLTSNFTGALTGNASSASVLQTPRTINGVAFDGSADISISASVDSSLSAGYGITGSPFNGSLGRTWVVDTTKIVPYTDTLKSWGIATKSNVYSKQNTIYANIKDFGAVGDGVTDDRSAIVSAFATGLPVFVPIGKFYISAPIVMTDYQTIRGVGDSSIICLKTGNYAALSVQGSYVKISNLSIRGKGRGTTTPYATSYPNQHGISIIGTAGVTYARSEIDIDHCLFDSLGGAGVYINQNRKVIYGNAVSATNNRALHSWGGIMTDTSAEYNTFVNNNISECEYAIYNKGGNNNFIGGMLTYNRVGFYLKKGVNDGHNAAIGITINHSVGDGIWADSLQTGFLFSGCVLYYSNIVLDYSDGIRFEGCTIGQVEHIYASGSTNGIFNNTYWATTPTFDLAYGGSSSTINFFGNKWAAYPAYGIVNEVLDSLQVPVTRYSMLRTNYLGRVIPAIANTDYLTPDTLSVYLKSATASSTYLPKAGGTMTGALKIDWASSALDFEIKNSGGNGARMDFNSTLSGHVHNYRVGTNFTLNDEEFAIYDVTNAATRFKLSKDGDITIQKNITAENLVSGTYTPTLVNTTNISTSALTRATYMRVGDVVQVTISFTLTPTAANTNSVVSFTLPVSTTNTSQVAIGVGQVYYSTANDYTRGATASINGANSGTFNFYPITNAATTATISFQYTLN